jgi:ethanolamine ammonia-lyase small subunit
MPLPDKKIIAITEEDNWSSLKAYTDARIALGRTGVAVPLKETLQFRLAHAYARDAVYSRLDTSKLIAGLKFTSLPVITAFSEAKERSVYLQRPDMGRMLDVTSAKMIEEERVAAADISIIIADGLSATAVNDNAVPFLEILIPLLKQQGFTLSPIVLVKQGRVSIADEIGSLLHARLSLILIGERPGLSSADSMGAYITYMPQPGLTDEKRNCVSNIRPAGLEYTVAAQKINFLVSSALRLQLSGVELKDDDSHFIQ